VVDWGYKGKGEGSPEKKIAKGASAPQKTFGDIRVAFLGGTEDDWGGKKIGGDENTGMSILDPSTKGPKAGQL